MRIDHFLVNKALMPRVSACYATGKGIDNTDPSFLGSDHCPLVCQFTPEPGASQDTRAGRHVQGNGNGAEEPDTRPSQVWHV